MLLKPKGPKYFPPVVTLYIYTMKQITFKQKLPKVIYHFNMAAKLPLPIFASPHFYFSDNTKKKKKKKKTLPKEFFNQIWLIIGDYEYIHS